MPSNHLILCLPFSSRSQSYPASGSFQMIQFVASGGQSIGVSASASVLPLNIQDWFPLGWTGWIFLQSKGLSRVFSNTTVQKLMLNSLKHYYLKHKHFLKGDSLSSQLSALCSHPVLCVSLNHLKATQVIQWVARKIGRHIFLYYHIHVLTVYCNFTA